MSYTKGYEVTEDGRVISFGSNWRGLGDRELGQIENPYGYMFVRLTVDGKRTTRLVHVLVAEKFIGKKPSSLHQVRHLDGNKKNNSAKNLAWGTAKENANDRESHGRTSRGEKHSIAIKSAMGKEQRSRISLAMKGKPWTEARRNANAHK